MSLFSPEDENAIYFSRGNANELMSTHTLRAFELDGLTWPTIAHYYHAMKFTRVKYQKKISEEPDPKKASILGRTRLKVCARTGKRFELP